jgi:hypothetical protein
MRCVQLWKNSINVLWMNTLKNEGYMDNFERLWLICGQYKMGGNATQKLFNRFALIYWQNVFLSLTIKSQKY